MDTATGIYVQRTQGFSDSVKKYQDALLEYRNVVKANPARDITANPAARSQGRVKAHAAFKEMQTKFHLELKTMNSVSNGRHRTPLSSASQGLHVARNHRSVAKLNIANHVEAGSLVKYSRHARYLGNGIAVIDFGKGVGNIQNSYETGGNWHREMFIESSSFAAGAIAADIVIKVGLSFLMVATPVGWVGLIVGGVAVVGVAAGAAMGMDSFAKSIGGVTYDKIMKEIGSR